MKKVYTIVIFENSASLLGSFSKDYIHHGRVAFDTGLKMDFLQEYCLVALDVFRKIPYSEGKNTQTAWLSLLTTEEVLHMFSEALKIMDRNTVRYMIEKQQEELEEKDQLLREREKEIESLKQQLAALQADKT